MLAFTVFLAGLFLAAAETPPTIVVLDFEAPAEQSDPTPARLVVTPREGDTRVFEGTVPGKLELPMLGPMTLRLEASGFWAAPAEVLGPGPTLVSMRLQPAATISGRLRAPKGFALPKAFDLRLQTSRRPVGGATRPEGQDLSCPLTDKGLFSCIVPSGTFDLRMKAAGFAAGYRWQITLGRDQEVRLGTEALRPGGSIVGWVEAEGGRPLGTTARAIAQAWTSSILPPTGGTGLQELRREAELDAHGFFQFQGLEAGRYWLSGARQGLAPSPGILVEVYEGLETIVRDPLVLTSPLTLEVRLDPPLDPEGRPWKLRMGRTPGATPFRELRGETDLSGLWLRQDLPRGPFRLHIESQRGDRWHVEDLELEKVVETRWIDLRGVAVEGRLLLRGEPVEGHIWFGRWSGAERVHLYAGSDGEFFGTLPRIGSWPLSVQLADYSDQRLDADPVEVEAPADGRPSRLEIELPAAQVRGVVVDLEGRPMPSVPLSASISHGSTVRHFLSQSEGDGRFEFPSLPAGRMLLSEEHPTLYGESVTVILENGATAEGVKISVYEPNWLQGRVRGPYGPLAGVRVFGLPDFAWDSYQVYSDSNQQTAADGTFRFPLPRSTGSLTLVVLAPGFGARTLSASSGPTPVDIELRPGGGTLELELQEEGTSSLPPPSTYLLTETGERLPLALFYLFWARPQGTAAFWPARLILPSMEPAEYTLCHRPEGAETGASSCSSGLLTPGGTLALSALGGAPAPSPPEAGPMGTEHSPGEHVPGAHVPGAHVPGAHVPGTWPGKSSAADP